MHVLSGGATGMVNMPAILADGYVFPVSGYSVFETGAYPVKVPVIIGTNKEETKLFLSFDLNLDWKSDLYKALAKYGSMRWKVEGVDDIAYALSVHNDQPAVYVYRFDWGAVNEEGKSPLPGDWGSRLGAFHSLEIPFFLGTDTILGSFMTGNLFTKKNLVSRKKLTVAIGQYLTAFTYTGDPNNQFAGPTNPVWEPWQPANSTMPCLLFDTKGDDLALSCIYGRLTQEIVDAQMYNELNEPLLSEVIHRLERSPVNAEDARAHTKVQSAALSNQWLSPAADAYSNQRQHWQ